ncbi:DUF4127 family protein [Schleiferilactobacillus perolens]|uniref:DUF4127 family protein n=1 Tax=Schleiferilactobacillus perolens TaxID=100468 RepID=UPI0023530992|nr:DUF4127 family protein [Schleiferilactobacillus perolens]MCI2169968.1 DUF4127 family protein [Schleiferilactobacillus perolens]
MLFIPLDERPCNYAYPIRLFDYVTDDQIISLPPELLGYRKHGANVELIRQFIDDNVRTAHVLVFSTEMVMFGGLLPSRVYDPVKQAPNIQKYEQFLTKLRQKYPGLKIFVSNLIMRTPRYSSGDEEPDYYEQYGKEIFRRGWLNNKSERAALTTQEKEELDDLQNTIPTAVIADYEGRRKLNLAVNLANVALVQQGIIDYLTIPQDDSAEYGYTAQDQAVVYGRVKMLRLQNRISIYPGADESGYTLLARAVQHGADRQTKIYPLYASPSGALTIPLYEDRPLNQTIEAHILAAGALPVETPAEASMILAVNTPGNRMIEASSQRSQPELTYDTYRNLRGFVAKIKMYLSQKKYVAVADSGYANGGDLELAGMLEQAGLIDQLAALRAWNTDANTVGSTIATAIILRHATQRDRYQELLSCFLDDYCYQAIIRQQTVQNLLPALGLNYFNLGEQSKQVADHVTEQTVEVAKTFLPSQMATLTPAKISISFPWNRMFEVNARL